jgi:hypothetical protein
VVFRGPELPLQSGSLAPLAGGGLVALAVCADGQARVQIIPARPALEV